MDESPEVLGRPAVNTLILRAVNSTSLSVLLSRVLAEFGKDFRDLMVISSDSAEYMAKLVRYLQMSYSNKLLHIKDVPHLIDVAVDFANHSESVAMIMDCLMKMSVNHLL